ncbi:MAG: hypothetical protein H2042_03085 [Rhizobiales bacterium]|nr:hypothetical protein [Hyphomicrobiales bacterium]
MTGLTGADESADTFPGSGHSYRDALRILFILVRGSVPLDAPSDGWDNVFLGEKRALAIDFWLRYPDYLADQLLDLYQREGNTALLDASVRIFEDEEPDVRLVRMIRWRRGAYDDLQTSLCALGYRGLVRAMKRTLPHGHIYEYLSGPLARQFLNEALAAQPALEWYERQTRLALLVAENKSGTALKDIHYGEEAYATTPYGALIPSIKEKVQSRIATLKGQ